MADFLIQATLSNLLVSTVLAAIAWVVQRRVRSASLANLLWAIVLIKMITPPIIALPIVVVPRAFGLPEQPTVSASNPHSAGRASPKSGSVDVDTPTRVPTLTPSVTSQPASPTASVRFWSHGWQAAIFAWLAGSSILCFVSALRIVRFHRLLQANSRVDHELSSGLSAEVGRQFAVGRNPHVVIVSANIAPFVWWASGRPIIVISERARRRLDENDLRFVITHEMAHIKRRDHWFRWLEWVALTGLWWNPVMWWARAQLRLSEELACDDLVLETTRQDVHQYANSLLNVAELLTSPVIRPPVVASAMNGGGNLETRLKMMIAEKTWKVPAALRLGIVAIAMGLFPLGLVYAQDFAAVHRRLGEAVKAGELSVEQADAMMKALKQAAGSKQDRDSELELKKRLYWEFTREVEAAVAAGRVTKEEAEKKLIVVRKEMFGVSGEKKKSKGEKALDRAALQQRYNDLVREIEAAVKADKLTKEQAKEKLAAARKEVFAAPGEKKRSKGKKDNGPNLAALKQRFADYARKIEAAVKAGELTKEDAEKKLSAARKEVFGAPKAKKKLPAKQDSVRDLEALKQRYAEYARKLEAAVKAKELAREEAERKLRAARKEMFGEPGDKPKAKGKNDAIKDLEARKRRFEDVARKLEDAVKAGKLAKEEAEKKLAAVRKERFGKPGEKKKAKGKKDKGTDGKRKARERYEQAARRIKAAVDKGNLSPNEGEQRLAELRKQLFGGDD